jgi:hypothetical protein
LASYAQVSTPIPMVITMNFTITYGIWHSCGLGRRTW